MSIMASIVLRWLIYGNVWIAFGASGITLGSYLILNSLTKLSQRSGGELSAKKFPFLIGVHNETLYRCFGCPAILPNLEHRPTSNVMIVLPLAFAFSTNSNLLHFV